MFRLFFVGILMLSACGSKDAEPSQPAELAKEAGKVIDLTGKVTATRAGAVRTLAVGNQVSAEDVIDTGKDGSVVIELFHNNARWSVESEITAKVDESVAWGLSKQAAANTVDHATSAAGRHADRQAADTAVTARDDVPSRTPTVTAEVRAPEKPAAIVQAPTRPSEPKVDSKPTTKDSDARKSGGGCDEVACVIDPSLSCCSKYKKGGPKPPPPPNSDLPEALDRQAIQQAMKAIGPRILECGTKAGVTGTIKITVKVGASGSVTGAEIKQSPDAKVDACVIDVIKAVKFPATRSGGNFSYPFVLN